MENENLNKEETANSDLGAVRRSYLEEVFPICTSKDGYTINLAGMQKHSPTGDNWGYAPFQKTYKTHDEAEKVRKELWKTIKRWVDNYA
jgi:hypothetical protein